MELSRINPDELGPPKGYSNGVLVGGGRLLFIAGQIAWDAEQRLVGERDFLKQFEQAMRNVLAVLREAGGGPEGLCELTMFVTDKQAYINRVKEIGAVWRELCGKHFPAMALVEVKGLLEPGAMIEIRGVAAIE
jgi:enamine deaminase RidA (YjgF/YER057c/UK114 family)